MPDLAFTGPHTKPECATPWGTYSVSFVHYPFYMDLPSISDTSALTIPVFQARIDHERLYIGFNVHDAFETVLNHHTAYNKVYEEGLHV